MSGAHRLLLVDDDTGLLRLLSMRLKASGYAVSTAETAEAALLRLAVERFSLVVCDVRLPDRDGLSLFGDIRLAVRKRTTENGFAGDVMVNARTGRPELEAPEGTMLREYRDARQALMNDDLRKKFARLAQIFGAYRNVWRGG